MSQPIQESLRIFTVLNNAQIRYCHWKSNANLSRSFESDADFDLLIDVCDGERFHLCLQKLGLKRRYSTADKVYPGMEDYLGFDKTSGKIIHLHIHFKLVIGKANQKNYRIPIEDEVLNTSICDENHPIKIIRPELEFVLLLIRSILKLAVRVKLAAKFLLKKDIFPSNIRKEFTFLQGRIDRDIFNNYVKDLFPDLSDVFSVMSQGNLTHLSYFQLLKFHKRITRYLRSFRLFSNRELNSEIRIKRLSSQNSRSWLGTGGVSVAFVGADGAGKSSTVSNIKKWLSWKLSVESTYMGLPKNRLIWKLLTHLSKVANKLRISSPLKKSLHPCRWVYAAKSRYKNYRNSEMFKNQGGIILFDRFPLREFWNMAEPMDGPRIIDSNRWKDVEQKFYNRMRYPDYVFILVVNGKDAIKRKEEHHSRSKQQAIKKKIRAINTLLEASNERFIPVDTSKGQQQVLLEIKRKMWGLL